MLSKSQQKETSTQKSELALFIWGFVCLFGGLLKPSDLFFFYGFVFWARQRSNKKSNPSPTRCAAAIRGWRSNLGTSRKEGVRRRAGQFSTKIFLDICCMISIHSTPFFSEICRPEVIDFMFHTVDLCTYTYDISPAGPLRRTFCIGHRS